MDRRKVYRVSNRRYNRPHVFDGKPIIGLVGGIGAGKSFVARLFEELGCVVIHSDAMAHAVHELPVVREALRSWWGGARSPWTASILARSCRGGRRQSDTFPRPSDTRRRLPCRTTSADTGCAPGRSARWAG